MGMPIGAAAVAGAGPASGDLVGCAAGAARLPKVGGPPFSRPMGRKRIPKASSMLEVPCAATGSGVGMMQKQESLAGVRGPLKRYTPAPPMSRKKKARVRNSESNYLESKAGRFLSVSREFHNYRICWAIPSLVDRD